MNYKNGKYYIGNWKEGYEEGKGTMIYNNGDIYEGLFEKGIRNG